MSKGELCLVGAYAQSSWKEYWEGTRLRENLNIGTFTSKRIMPMAGYGITDRWNVFAGLPHISNSSDAGTMMHMEGWQDLSLDVKFKAFDNKNKKLRLMTFFTAGGSTPISNYVPDFLPYSIGLGATTAKLGVVEQLEHQSGLFATFYTGYQMRSKIEVDRSSYYTDRQYYSKEMAVPDVWEGSVRLGYNKKLGRIHAAYNWNISTSGTDMRRNDMPYPGNKMDAQTISIGGLLWIPPVKGLAVLAMADQVIAGRNMGKAFTWMAGLQYVFKPFHKKQKDNETKQQ